MSGRCHMVAIGDCHAPFAHKPTIDWAIAKIKELQPDNVVQVGDLTDQYYASRYPKTFGMTPQQEFNRARAWGETFWARVHTSSPGSSKYQLLGNHDVRVYKKIADKAPELSGIAGIGSYFKFDHVVTLNSDREVLELKLAGERVMFHHGWLSKLGDHVNYFNSSCVVGHSHRPGIFFLRRHNRLIWEANCGHVADENAGVFTYGETTKKHWGRGILVVDDDGPRFISAEGLRRA